MTPPRPCVPDRYSALMALGRIEQPAPQQPAAEPLAAMATPAEGPAAENEGTAADGVEVGWKDVQAALPHVRPSALRDLELHVPRVGWGDIGGQEELKQARSGPDRAQIEPRSGRDLSARFEREI